VVVAAVQVDLESGEAARQHVIHHALHVAEIHARLHFAIGIHTNLVAEFAAQQLINRHAQRLALQIPQGQLDARERRNKRTGEPTVEHMRAAHLFKERVDPKWISTDEAGTNLLDDGDRLHAAMYTLPNTCDVGIRLDSHPQMHPMTAGSGSLNRGDLHAFSSPVD